MRKAALVLFATSCLFPSLDELTAGGEDASLDVGGEDASDSGDAGLAQDVATDALALGSYVGEVSKDSPASWWRLGELDASSPAKDEEGAQIGAYHVPGVLLGQKGAIASDTNTAMRLDGVTGAMSASGSAYDFGNSPPFAIEVWVAPSAPPDAADQVRRVVSHRTSTPATGWMLILDGTQQVTFQRMDNDVVVGSVTTSAPIATGAFTYLAVSSDGATMSLYVNGALVSSSPAPTIPVQTAPGLVWGASSGFGQEFLAGTLDEPAIYTHALSPERVLAHYQAGLK